MSDKPKDGTVTLHFPEHGKARIRAYGDGICPLDLIVYLGDACRAVQRDTGKLAMTYFAQFSDETGHGTEITVIPHHEDAREAHYA
jgi:hypothetical protein